MHNRPLRALDNTRMKETQTQNEYVNPFANIDILCLNCMKMINITHVETHSVHCFKEQSEVQLVEFLSPVQRIHFHIHKLVDSLIRIQTDINAQLRDERDELYVKCLLDYANQLLKIVDFTQADILRSRQIISNIIVKIAEVLF